MIVNVLIFVLVLSVLVIVHELGHFLVARRLGVLVEEFGVGLPPRIFSKKIGETLYSVNLLPFGGFVRLHGESEDAKITDPQRAYVNKSKKARTAIILAGVVMNFLLAIVAFSLVYSFSGIPRQTDRVRILEVAAGSPANIAGLLASDLVKKVDEEEVRSVDAFVALIDAKKGEEVVIEIERSGAIQKIEVEPRADPPKGEGPLGVAVSSIETYFAPVWQRPFVGIYFGFKEALFWGMAVIAGLIKIFSDLFSGVAPKDVAGPIGVFVITSQAAKEGILVLLNFVGVFSVNLALFNLVPFPALDGGRLLFVGIERLLGRRLLPKLEWMFHAVGLALLLLLLLVISAREVKILSEVGFSGFIDRVLR